MQWHEIEGFFDTLDKNFVVDQCLKVKNGIVVEIGGFAGKSTAAMAPTNQRNNNKHYVIDNFKGGSEPPDAATKAQQTRDMKFIFEENMKTVGLDQYINLIIKNSIDAAKCFKNRSIDFCFIDGDHHYNGIMSDLMAWYPKIKMGSILAGHDYRWHEVKKAVHDFGIQTSEHINNHIKCWSIIRTKEIT